MNTIQFRALSTTVRVTTADAALHDGVRSLTASYPSAHRPPDLFYALDTGASHQLCCNGEIVRRVAQSIDLIAAFELDLFRRVVARAQPDRWLLHAAAVCTDRGALVLAGPSGAGKSTLTLALTARGADYISDDCVSLTAAGEVDGVARPISFDVSCCPLPIPTQFRSTTYPIRTFVGEVANPLLLHPPDDRLRRVPVRLHAVVRIQYQPDAPRGLRPLTTGDALKALWPESLGRGPEALAIATTVLSQHPRFELTTNNVDDACAALTAINDSAAGGDPC